jgi:hypothetical protein
VITPVATQPDGRGIKVFAQNPAKLIVDVTGYFTSSVSAQTDVGLFVPIDPDASTRNPARSASCGRVGSSGADPDGALIGAPPRSST